MRYHQEIILKNGAKACIRNGDASDGLDVYENFNQTHAETDYLLSYPDENSYDPEQEARFLKEKTASPNEIEIIALVDGKVVGTAGIEAVGHKYIMVGLFDVQNLLEGIVGIAVHDDRNLECVSKSINPSEKRRKMQSLTTGSAGGAEFREFIANHGAYFCIPPKKDNTDPWYVDWWLYKERHLVETFFLKLKEFRRVATRFDKLASRFLAFVHLACIRILLA